MGFLDPVLRSEAAPNLWPCQQSHDGLSGAHGDLHLQVLPVSCNGATLVSCMPACARTEQAIHALVQSSAVCGTSC